MAKHNSEEAILVQRGFGARLFHAIIFEVIAIILTTIFLWLVMQGNVLELGVLSILVSLVATLWNGVFNFLFDRLQNHYHFPRSTFVRVMHALGFEGGLLIFTVPLVMVYLSTDIVTAFLVEAGLLAFFLPYSLVFNYIYDKIYIAFYR